MSLTTTELAQIKIVGPKATTGNSLADPILNNIPPLLIIIKRLGLTESSFGDLGTPKQCRKVKQKGPVVRDIIVNDTHTHTQSRKESRKGKLAFIAISIYD